MGHDVNVIGWNHPSHASECLLQQTFTCAQNIQKLLGLLGGTGGPKATSDTSSHNYGIRMFHDMDGV
jgi:hypothetical protein